MEKKTVVLGASMNPSRYSYLAIKKLTQHGHPVLAIGRRKGNIGSTEIKTTQENEEGVDTVTLYINSQNQKEYYDYILGLKPNRIIFNPGTENEELARMAKEKGIEAVEACTLVMLSIGAY
ncbi:MAG: CoA-binding protein [Chitinophagaceae bacterium]